MRIILLADNGLQGSLEWQLSFVDELLVRCVVAGELDSRKDIFFDDSADVGQMIAKKESR